MRQTSVAIVVLYATCIAGCAVTYYDEESSTMHMFGFGHMKMRVPDESNQTVYHEVNDYGVSIGTSRVGGHVNLGHYSETVLDIADDQSLCFEWPRSDLFTVRVGRDFPLDESKGCIDDE